jgi:hypothetical protein
MKLKPIEKLCINGLVVFHKKKFNSKEFIDKYGDDPYDRFNALFKDLVKTLNDARPDIPLHLTQDRDAYLKKKLKRKLKLL